MADDTQDIERLMSLVDAPVRLPSDLRAALVDALGGEPLLAGIDAPRPLPGHLRARLASALTARSPRHQWLAVAAAIVLVAGGVTAISRIGTGTPARSSSGIAAAAPRSGPTTSAVAGPTSQATSGAVGAVPALPSASGSAAVPFDAGGATASAAGAGPPPPFGDSITSPPLAAMPAGPSAQATATPAPAPLLVAVVGGNAAEQSGFDAYLSLLNQNGGINGHPVRAVAAPHAGAVATVNLSDAPTAKTSGPVLETLAVPDGILRGSTFDVASAPVHQAVVAVNAMFPNASPGTVAVIYRGTSGVWATDVPNAMAAALRQRSVTPIVMPYSAGAHLGTSPAKTAFLSLDSADVRAWFGDADRANYHPRVAAIESAAEPSIAKVMPDGTRVVAPYDIPSSGEHASLASGIGAAPGIAAEHGWVTAKVLAVALWRSGAVTAAAANAALAQMSGYNDGFSPPLSFRPGTNSRLPDGTVLTVQNHTLVTSGVWARDPA
jgi:hypothetical protein